MKRFIYGLIIMSLVLAAGCGGSVDSEDVTVSAVVPDGWRANETVGNVVVLEYVNDQGAFFFAAKEGATDKNLENHVEDKKSYYLEQYGDVQWLETAKPSIDGREALEITYIAENYKQREAYVMIGKSVFKFSILAAEEDFQGIMDDYNSILESVKFN